MQEGTNWIVDSMTTLPQYLRICNGVSDIDVRVIAAPWSTAKTLFLFTLCTADFRYNSPDCDSVSLITDRDDGLYKGLIQLIILTHDDLL